MKLFNLIAVKGKDTFGLSVWAKNIKDALSSGRRMLTNSGYAIHPAK